MNKLRGIMRMKQRKRKTKRVRENYKENKIYFSQL